MTSRHPNQNVERLQATISVLEDVRRELEEQKEMFIEYRRANEEDKKRTNRMIEVLWAKNQGLEARQGFLESLQDIEEDAEEGEDGEDGEETRNNATAAGLVAQEHRVDIKESEELAKAPAIKAVIKETYELLLGVPSLVKMHLPDFPADANDWPKDPATGENLLRFNWNASVKEPVNARGFLQIKDSIRASGAQRIPSAQEVLPKVLDAHLLARIIKKFSYMAKQYKKFQEETANLDDDGFGRDEPDSIEPDEGPIGRMDASTRRTRARTVAEVRRRKAIGTEWDSPKYAAAFLINAQSDYEDDKDHIPNRYIRRAPEWRSELLQRIIDEVDARKDPLPDKSRSMFTRVAGGVLKGVKPAQANLEYRVRAWMVKPDVLAANPDWFSSRRVARNGKLWGEDEDPVEETLKRTIRGQGGRKSKRPRATTSAAIADATARISQVTQGIDPELLLDSLVR